jgi:predicted metal-dependent hydrolase
MTRRAAITEQQLEVGDQTIPYTVTYTNRKSVGITVRPNLSVAVRAPFATTPEAIAQIMQKRASWIVRHLQRFAQRAAPPVIAKPAGTTIQYLGAHIPLKIEPLPLDSTRKESVCLGEDSLRVFVKDPQNQKRVDTLVEQWSRIQAYELFSTRMAVLMAKFDGQLKKAPSLAIRRMKARWGSCSVKGKIILSLSLIHQSLPLIDCVIMHELCHLIEHNHSKRFYALLTRMMPDWKQREQQLMSGLPTEG